MSARAKQHETRQMVLHECRSGPWRRGSRVRHIEAIAMSHELNLPGDDSAKSMAPKNPRSTWIVIAVLLIFLAIFAIAGLAGVAAWLFLAGVFVLLTAGYALLRQRESWARLGNQKRRRQALAVGAALCVLSFVAAAVAAPLSTQQTADEQEPSPTPEPSTGSASPTEASLANQVCPVETEAKSQQGTEYICTLNSAGKLLWLDQESSAKVVEARKVAAQRAEDEANAKVEAERQAAEVAEARRAEEAAAEAQRQAEEAAAADNQRRTDEAAAAEAQRLADEAAAAESRRQAEEEAAAAAERQAAEAAEAQRQAAEAQRLAEEQARQQSDAFVYENCTAVEAAGADPIRPGDYGWQSKLDGNDNDGVGCE